jgi:hypothetical protein
MIYKYSIKTTTKYNDAEDQKDKTMLYSSVTRTRD